VCFPELGLTNGRKMVPLVSNRFSMSDWPGSTSNPRFCVSISHNFGVRRDVGHGRRKWMSGSRTWKKFSTFPSSCRFWNTLVYGSQNEYYHRLYILHMK
jgi:hypothetical protein